MIKTTIRKIQVGYEITQSEDGVMIQSFYTDELFTSEDRPELTIKPDLD